jgi:effector-binding domain-containing protein
MKKKIVIIFIFVALSIIVLFFPVTHTQNISILASFDNTMLQLVHLENWKNWYPDIKEAYLANCSGYQILKDSSQKNFIIIADKKKYIIHKISLGSYQINVTNNNSSNIFAFEVLPDTLVNHMKATVLTKMPLFYVLLKSNTFGVDAIMGLKSYLEDSKSFYGFRIEKSKIRDSVIASISSRAKKKDTFLKIQDVHLKLMHYIKSNNLTISGCTSISFSEISKDSIYLTVGIPVNRIAPSDNGINCLQLPGKGNVVVGYFEGSFFDRRKIYWAMSKYLNDHFMSSPSEPFERYLDDSIPLSDSSKIKIELNYPIY